MEEDCGAPSACLLRLRRILWKLLKLGYVDPSALLCDIAKGAKLRRVRQNRVRWAYWASNRAPQTPALLPM
eukprot:2477516-Amphidinium_carterae.2